MRRIPTCEMPYTLVYGTKSVIPIEIGIPSFMMMDFDKKNEANLRLNFDLFAKIRKRAEVRQAAYKHQVTKYYNKIVKHKSFLPGDLALKEVTLFNAGKLGSTWEGSYKVIKVSGQELIG